MPGQMKREWLGKASKGRKHTASPACCRPTRDLSIIRHGMIVPGARRLLPSPASFDTASLSLL